MKITKKHKPLIEQAVRKFIDQSEIQDKKEDEYETEFPEHPELMFTTKVYLHEKGEFDINPEKNSYQSHLEVTEVKLTDEDCKEIPLPQWAIDMFPEEY